MRRLIIAICFILICVPAVTADEPGIGPLILTPGGGVSFGFTVGDKGPLSDGYFLVDEIIDDKTVLLSYGAGKFFFIARGASTEGFADGVKVKAPGTWKVTKTEKIGSRTFFVVEPVDKAAKLVRTK